MLTAKPGRPLIHARQPRPSAAPVAPVPLTPSAKDFRGADEIARAIGSKASGGKASGGKRGGAPALLSDGELATFFARLHAIEPEPKGELEHVNAFTLLVAVVLSAQATDAGVNKATRALFAVADTARKMLELGEEAVRDHVKTIGLYRNKAKNVMLLSEKLIREKDGIVPADRDYLVTLPGVGRKTANVVLNMAFGIPTMAVDTHVFRVSNRMPHAIGRTPEEIEERLMRRIPDAYALHAHHWLILHGRYTCKARAPECHRCVVNDLCKSPEKRLPPTP